VSAKTLITTGYVDLPVSYADCRVQTGLEVVRLQIVDELFGGQSLE
jgi:hypothetical protein